jgi:hypothetical protein
VTWVKLASNFAEDPRLEDAGAEALAIHVAGLCYSVRQSTDGHIPRKAAQRLWSVPDISGAITALIKVGLWQELEDGSGYEIVDFLKDQMSAEEVESVRELWRVRQHRSRQHKLGDHTLCIPRYCDRAAEDVTRDSQSESPVIHGSRNASSRTATSRPDREGGRDVGTWGERAGARPAGRPGARPGRRGALNGPASDFVMEAPEIAFGEGESV